VIRARNSVLVACVSCLSCLLLGLTLCPVLSLELPLFAMAFTGSCYSWALRKNITMQHKAGTALFSTKSSCMTIEMMRLGPQNYRMLLRNIEES